MSSTDALSTKDCNAFEDRMEMLTYREMYNIMFNAATDAIEKIENASAILCKAQQNCEEILMETADDTEAPSRMDPAEE